MGFTHIQGVAAVGSSASPSCTLTGTTAGSVICVGVIAEASSTTLSVTGFTVTPNAPSTFVSGGGQSFMAYKLNAVGGNLTITGTLGASQSWTMWAEEFGVSGGTASFDKDAKANTAGSSTAINTPSITPAASGSLLFSAVACNGTGSSPAAGGTQGVWTGSQGGINHGNISEYDLSAGAATAVNYTQSSGTYSCMSMAFTFTASGGGSTPNLRTLRGAGI